MLIGLLAWLLWELLEQRIGLIFWMPSEMQKILWNLTFQQTARAAVEKGCGHTWALCGQPEEVKQHRVGIIDHKIYFEEEIQELMVWCVVKITCQLTLVKFVFSQQNNWRMPLPGQEHRRCVAPSYCDWCLWWSLGQCAFRLPAAGVHSPSGAHCSIR